MSNLISRDDAIRELSGACSTWEDDAKVQEIIMAIPSAKQTGDLISRADAIEAVASADETNGTVKVFSGLEVIDILKALPSAEIPTTGEKHQLSAETPTNAPTDLISRANAIRWVKTECNQYGKPTLDYDSGLKVIEHLKKMPSELPSAEAVQGWIPVEEQPPVFPCLVCDANGNQPSVPLGIVTITDEEHGEWHIDGRLWDTKIFFKGEWCSQTGYGNRIIAWMPLPKPYKGGDDE